MKFKIDDFSLRSLIAKSDDDLNNAEIYIAIWKDACAEGISAGEWQKALNLNLKFEFLIDWPGDERSMRSVLNVLPATFKRAMKRYLESDPSNPDKPRRILRYSISKDRIRLIDLYLQIKKHRRRKRRPDLPGSKPDECSRYW